MQIVVHSASSLGAARGLVDHGAAGLLTLLGTGQPVGSELAGEHVLMLVPRHRLATAREQAHVLLSRAPRTHVCVLPSDHHPLTLAVTGAVLGDLASSGQWSNPGHAVQLAQQILADSRSLVWHPRVNSLTQPAPRLAQRWASLLPGRHFLTQLGTDEVRPADGLEIRPGEDLFVSGAVPADLQKLLAPLRISKVDVTTDARAPYRSRGSVELCALVPPRVVPPQGRPCDNCGAVEVGHWCPFCNLRTARSLSESTAASTATAAGAGPANGEMITTVGAEGNAELGVRV